jgi:hypothetical protein
MPKFLFSKVTAVMPKLLFPKVTAVKPKFLNSKFPKLLHLSHLSLPSAKKGNDAKKESHPEGWLSLSLWCEAGSAILAPLVPPVKCYFASDF